MQGSELDWRLAIFSTFLWNGHAYVGPCGSWPARSDMYAYQCKVRVYPAIWIERMYSLNPVPRSWHLSKAWTATKHVQYSNFWWNPGVGMLSSGFHFCWSMKILEKDSSTRKLSPSWKKSLVVSTYCTTLSGYNHAQTNLFFGSKESLHWLGMLQQLMLVEFLSFCCWVSELLDITPGRLHLLPRGSKLWLECLSLRLQWCDLPFQISNLHNMMYTTLSSGNVSVQHKVQLFNLLDQERSVQNKQAD